MKHNGTTDEQVIYEKLCNWCKFPFVSKRKTKRFCTIKCRDEWNAEFRQSIEYKTRISNIQKQLYKDGITKGWASRTKLKPSYPEQYFINLFDTEHIDYQREVKFGRYFADFYFENQQLILEVDGSQHNREPYKQSDIRKDQYLSEQGFTVFRIKWVNPTNNKNRSILYEQINEFKKLL
jgi:very-short-patch-repair endonuclease